jgi:hypothetical protein
MFCISSKAQPSPNNKADICATLKKYTQVTVDIYASLS